ncbi:TonB-dependent receptor [Stenotrophomonas maltophilia]|uniref:STN domain-containing protein n=1 Tax=Stenotrophomonas maltophilia TaxID=40324 RepID=UPI0013DA99A7|nr:STN domain-containing protein [Stenotrophomonas maltophilia]MBA0279516.1 TonB-dependent receptor [Stenotrophomonas maltophilia]MBA0343984.1 TonB-dependent receptor [Stenotrophomonas maltophilia]MBA0356618.1 TonB-dependent receptor [Stenotrophomonas maltophilia]MBA0518097.1 TonB-dependent receptor [Stenotrophomonas maltophilia]
MFYVRGLNGHHAIRTWGLAIAGWLLLAFAAAAQDGVHAYDIPAQPLEQAVERFSVISGWSVMYPGDLAAGRNSHQLRASLAPLPALQMLLQDTGIEAEVIGEQRVVLRRGTPSAAEPGVGAELLDAERRRRYGDLQQRLRAAFCDDPEIAPGRYAATLRFRVDGEGQAQQPELLSGSGSARRDARLLQALQGLVLAPDAAALPQPVTLQIRPSGTDHDCGRRAPLP